MAKRMLIDATHPEETRVVTISGNRLEEFDFETSTKKQIKGNIYLAKVTRVEPSLQAAFVEFGGNRHGFLAFNEIHPDYYRIPVADREPESEPEEESSERALPAAAPGAEYRFGPTEAVEAEAAAGAGAHQAPEEPSTAPEPSPGGVAPWSAEAPHEQSSETVSASAPFGDAGPEATASEARAAEAEAAAESAPIGAAAPEDGTEKEAEREADSAAIETVGGDEVEEEQRQPRARSHHHRHYKIQEVIKRRQIMLVQVTKEERGTKGAALTTYLSLAGRYCVLMPNTPRGGGVSRKITSAGDRRRLKELVEELELPEGMGVIVRTAGSERSKAEIKRDFDYLIRLWDEIRDLTLRSTAPALIYEEGNLIKRSIRDLYARDVEEVLVDGEEGYRTAKAFMKMLMPSHAKRVQPYRDPAIPLFHRFQIESQIDAIHSPVVQLKSGGYIVINPTEALVAIDVNSGRSTKERNIEETALRTNLEAADEIARQLRLRDLAGLIVIDFIDMEEHRNQTAVERRLKEAMKHDRARIQLGRISPFGLLELSRQRLRPSLLEASTQPCPHCSGTGTVRSTESTALVVLRAVEEEGIRRRSAEISIAVPTHVALYILNQKREALGRIEERYGFRVTVGADDELIPPAFRLERVRALTPAEAAAYQPPAVTAVPVEEIEEEEEEGEVEERAAEPAETGHAGPAEEEHGRRRRRRRRRRHGEERGEPAAAEVSAEGGAEEAGEAEEPAAAAEAPEPAATAADGNGEERRHRRRGRRGGRRRGRRGEPGSEVPLAAVEGVEERFLEAADAEPAVEAADERPLTESVELVETAEAPPPAAVEAAAPAVAAPEAIDVAEAPVVEGGEAMPSAASSAPLPEAPPPAEPGPAAAETVEVAPNEQAETEQAETAHEEPASANPLVPPPHLVEERPANPRRGWWRRFGS